MCITGWWYTYPSEKYESQLGLLFPIYGEIIHVPNHQPDNYGMGGFQHYGTMFVAISPPVNNGEHWLSMVEYNHH